VATEEEIAEEGLLLPAGAVHQDIEVDDGGKIHVVSMGKGQPLVLLHGVFLNSGIWAHQLTDLTDEYRVIAMDFRGHGLSVAGSDGFGLTAAGKRLPAPTGPPEGLPVEADLVGDLLGDRRGDSSLMNGSRSNGSSSNGSHSGASRETSSAVVPRSTSPAHARRGRTRLGSIGSFSSLRRRPPTAIERLALDVRAVLDALDVERGVLVGHSMGGMVAIQAAAGLPKDERHHRLAGLMLTSTTTGPFLAMPGWDLFAAVTSPAALRLAHASARKGKSAIPDGDIRWWASRLAFGAEAPATQVRFVESMLAKAEQPTMEGLLESLARVNLTKQLDAIDLPTLVTVGTQDRLTPPWHSKKLEKGLADARLVELPRCGHMPMLERRREFDRLLEEHARKVS
jgi:pimeloyl-ACP methyl ester carboxylesterase